MHSFNMNEYRSLNTEIKNISRDEPAAKGTSILYHKQQSNARAVPGRIYQQPENF